MPVPDIKIDFLPVPAGDRADAQPGVVRAATPGPLLVTVPVQAPSRPPRPRIPAEYRRLTDTEILSLAPVFEAQGAALPHLQVSEFWGAVKNGRVVGCLVVQLVIHAEPMWIEEGHSEVFKGMVNAAEESIAQAGGGNVFLFAPEGRIARLAETQGMERYSDVCYFRQVASTVPEAATVPTEIVTDDDASAADASESEMTEDTEAPQVELEPETEVVQDEL